jgi:hypothetical protein
VTVARGAAFGRDGELPPPRSSRGVAIAAAAITAAAIATRVCRDRSTLV